MHSVVFFTILFTFSRSSAEGSKVQLLVQTDPVVANVGGDVILHCTLRNTVSTVNAVDESVEWQRPDLRPKEVHFYSGRHDNKEVQNEKYRGRTSLFEDELKNGNISLKLSRVTFTDDGNYSCFVPSLDRVQKATVLLIVASPPVISIAGLNACGVVLKCESGGWHVKPDLTWLDSDGNILPAGPTVTQTEPDGRYTLRREVTVQKTRNNTFTCRVTQQQINHIIKTQIHVPDQMFPEHCQPWWSWLTAGLAGAAVVRLAQYLYGCVCNFREKIKRKRARDAVDSDANCAPLKFPEDSNL